MSDCSDCTPADLAAEIRAIRREAVAIRDLEKGLRERRTAALRPAESALRTWPPDDMASVLALATSIHDHITIARADLALIERRRRLSDRHLALAAEVSALALSLTSDVIGGPPEHEDEYGLGYPSLGEPT